MSVVLGGFPPLKVARGSVRKRHLESECLDPTPASSKLCNLEQMAKPLCATGSHLCNRATGICQQGLGWEG